MVKRECRKCQKLGLAELLELWVGFIIENRIIVLVIKLGKRRNQEVPSRLTNLHGKRNELIIGVSVE